MIASEYKDKHWGAGFFFFNHSLSMPKCALNDSYLRGRDVLDGAMFLQVPDDHETTSVADNHLVRVDRVLL